MHDLLQYFETSTRRQFREQFLDFCMVRGVIANENTDRQDIRNLLFKYFNTDSFKKTYSELALELQRTFGIPSAEFLIQKVPSPRVFRPGDHGTGWHSDYWYGHGKSFHTVWVPIKGCIEGATFEAISSAKQNREILDYYEKNPNDLGKAFQLLGCSTFEVCPPDDHVAVFHSSLLHGSLENKTTTERLSFDFRFGRKNDNTSTKDMTSYLKISNGKLEQNSFTHSGRFLKYIRGGKGLDTTAQHILIEGCCKNRSIEIVAQEAEIERFGQPMLIKHLLEINQKASKFDGIVVASKQLIDAQALQLIHEFKTDVYCVLENVWISEN